MDISSLIFGAYAFGFQQMLSYQGLSLLRVGTRNKRDGIFIFIQENAVNRYSKSDVRDEYHLGWSPNAKDLD